MTALLEVSDLTVSYNGKTAVRGVDLYVGAGEAVVLLGANGAGKTSVLRALTGMVHADGYVRFDGVSLLRRRPHAITRLGIAHVPEGRGLFPPLTVEENLLLGLRAGPARSDRSSVDSWYRTFPPLAERRHQRVGSLSGGEQQMVSIARALLMKPKLLLLDEPSLGLSPLLTCEMFETLAAVTRESGTALLIVEQNAHLALDLGSRAYVLGNGSIVLAGPTEELRGRDDIRHVYLGY